MGRDELLDYLVSKHETWDAAINAELSNILVTGWYLITNQIPTHNQADDRICHHTSCETISKKDFEMAQKTNEGSAMSRDDLGIAKFRVYTRRVDASSAQKPSISKPEPVNEVDSCTQNSCTQNSCTQNGQSTQSTPITTVNTTIDMVNSPPHYQVLTGVEVLDIRKAMLAKIPSDVGYVAVSHWDRALEYLMRCWHKNGLEDIKKARFYMDQLIGELENGE